MARPAAAEDVYRAISDPTRRAILDVLSARGEENVSALARPFRLSLPSLSRHLKVLRDAGLVTERRLGRQRLYTAKPGQLRDVSDWVKSYERFWNEKADALARAADESAKVAAR